MKSDTPWSKGRFGVPSRRFIGTQTYLPQLDHAARLDDVVLAFMIEKDCSMKQVEDIQLIMQHPAFGQLPQPLKEIAQLRVENQEASLAELGKMLDKPIGRSGVNHRLKKLSSIADEIRMQGSAEMRGKSEKEGN